jgi:hypothetical protein
MTERYINFLDNKGCDTFSHSQSSSKDVVQSHDIKRTLDNDILQCCGIQMTEQNKTYMGIRSLTAVYEKTCSVPGQNPGLDMQILPYMLVVPLRKPL